MRITSPGVEAVPRVASIYYLKCPVAPLNKKLSDMQINRREWSIHRGKKADNTNCLREQLDDRFSRKRSQNGHYKYVHKTKGKYDERSKGRLQ